MRPSHAAVGAACVALLLAGAGCDDDETAEPDLGPTGDPTLFFAEPASDAASRFCAEVTAEDDARVPLLVAVTEFYLRPPGACGTYVQCGHLALYVNDVLNNESGVPAIDLLLRKLADRYHDGSPLPESGEPDVLTLRAEAQNDAGATMTNHQGAPLEDTITLVTMAECPANTP